MEKNLLLNDVQMDTQTSYFVNGDINVFACPWNEPPTLTEGSKTSYRGRITVMSNGEAHFKAYRDGTKGPLYQVLYQTKHCRVFEYLSFRANVIAFLKATVLFVAHGGVWDAVMEDFIRWSLRYDLWCKMQFFGAASEEVEYGLTRTKKRGPQNLLDLLPDVFTREEGHQLRQRQGITQGSVGQMLSTWKKRQYIELVGAELPPTEWNRQQYAKTEVYLAKTAKVGQ